MKNLLTFSVNGNTIQAPPGILTGGLNNGGLPGAGNTLISTAILWLIIFAVILTLFVVVLSGIQWITSGGDKNKIQAARSRLTFAIIGLVIAIMAFGIINLFGGLFGLKLFTSPPYSNPCSGPGPC